ncbi:hypothetical protein EB061_10525 [bacterium]|nr:hypothetical protein [bacterium]
MNEQRISFVARGSARGILPRNTSFSLEELSRFGSLKAIKVISMKTLPLFLSLACLLFSPNASAWWWSEHWTCTYFFQMGGQRQSVTGEGSSLKEANQRAFDLCRRAGQYQACMEQLYQQSNCRRVE